MEFFISECIIMMQIFENAVIIKLISFFIILFSSLSQNLLQIGKQGMSFDNSVLLNLTVNRILRQTLSLVEKITETSIIF